MEIEVKLHRFTDASYTGTERDRRIYELAEEVRDAIREYQVSGDSCEVTSPAG
jgi:hypothetical protein